MVGWYSRDMTCGCVRLQAHMPRISRCPARIQPCWELPSSPLLSAVRLLCCRLYLSLFLVLPHDPRLRHFGLPLSVKCLAAYLRPSPILRSCAAEVHLHHGFTCGMTRLPTLACFFVVSGLSLILGQSHLDTLVTNKDLAPFLALAKAVRNGAVYGAKVRFPHALVYVIR